MPIRCKYLGLACCVALSNWTISYTRSAKLLTYSAALKFFLTCHTLDILEAKQSVLKEDGRLVGNHVAAQLVLTFHFLQLAVDPDT